MNFDESYGGQLQGLTPMQATQLSQLGTMDDRNAALQMQMQQAQALRGGGNAYKHTTATGAALAGIGDIIGAYASAKRERELEAQQQANFDKQDAFRKELVRAMRLGGVSGQQAPQQPATGPQYAPLMSSPGATPETL